ncbi:hypothetical protein [Streptosporangium amethystogenes]|uniref:hypothetical protein n=1 Tax=Streptosporangium amethystogenes TaxID=2002 RepID=UPI0012FC970D|nr:hypothetical protein [Streptosporangium amethystogenes]
MAIRAWEDAERHRMLYEPGNLGRLADAAMTRSSSTTALRAVAENMRRKRATPDER